MPETMPPPYAMRELLETPGWSYLVEHLIPVMRRYEAESQQYHAWPDAARAHSAGGKQALVQLLTWVYKAADLGENNPITRHGLGFLDMVHWQSRPVEPQTAPAEQEAPPKTRTRRHSGWAL